DSGRVTQSNFMDLDDPISLGDVNGRGAYSLHFNNGWLYSGGAYTNHFWVPGKLCMLYLPQTADRGIDLRVPGDKNSGMPTTDTLTATNVFDPQLSLSYVFDNNILDVASYGDYLIVALAKSGVQIFHRERPEINAQLVVDNTVQTHSARAMRLKILGSTLFVAGGNGGLHVYDLAEPLAPRLISAGNTERVEALDYYKDRLIIGGGQNGITVLELPHSLVVSSSVAQGEMIGQYDPITLRFNEMMDINAFTELAALKVVDTTPGPSNGQILAGTLTPVEIIEGAAQEYSLSFSRQLDHDYQIQINDGRNIRGGQLWTPFTLDVRVSKGAVAQPVITQVSNGAYHRANDQTITIKGDHFDAQQAKVFVDEYEVGATWVDGQTMTLSTAALDLLPLANGQHHIRVIQGEMTAHFLGGVLTADEFDAVLFEMSSQSGPVTGGETVSINASKDVILPGSKILLRSRSGEEIYTQALENGAFNINLHDDVKTLSHFTFMVPGVLEPDLYEVYLMVAGQQVFISRYSYTQPAGRSIDLPNYPPMVVGASQVVGNTLFVGVKDGIEPTAANRFLMEFGLEIYDITLWDNPLRRAQLRLDTAVTGLSVVDNVAYLAAQQAGLLVVDVSDLDSPYVISEMPASGYLANDVDSHLGKGILAMAASSELGDGFVRFFSLADADLAQPAGFNTIVFSNSGNNSDLQGQPVDLSWWKDELYVLFNREGQLYLAIFDGFGTNLSYKVQAVERGLLSEDGKLTDASLFIQDGQISITTGEEYLVLQADGNGDYATIYWQSIESNSGELLANGAGLFISSGTGLGATASPDLVVSGLTPPAGNTITKDERVTISFNKLINTNDVVQAIELLDGNSSVIDTSLYTVEGINTLSGGTVNIGFVGATFDSLTGELTVNLNTDVTALSGTHLLQPFSANYQLIEGTRPQIDSVNRINTSSSQATASHYFHGDGTEVAVIAGSGFGTDAAALTILLGNEVIGAEQIVSVTDNAIEVNVPKLFLGNNTAVLTVTVSNLTVSDVMYGAMVVMPATNIEEINPPTGPPQGGNNIDIYGNGFNPSTKILFGGSIANDIRVLASHHIRVKAPSGDFGYVSISAVNPQFPDESGFAQQQYFYAGQAAGSVNLSREESSPVSAIARNGQLLYVVTGGGYEVFDTTGAVTEIPTTKTAQLMVVDVTDPVNPLTINKDFANQTLPYFYRASLPEQGFTDMVVDGNDLYAIGGEKLLRFDVSLAADPYLLEDINNTQTNHAIAVKNSVVYLSQDSGVKIYHHAANADLRQIGEIDSQIIGGTASKLVIAGQTLWALVPTIHEAVAIELMSGEYKISKRIQLVDGSGYQLSGSDMLVHNNWLMVSTGENGTVELFDLLPDKEPQSGSNHLASLNLSYLLRNGNLSAGQMMLYGQTLYVAGGHGDLQLFDISPWLNQRFRAQINLRHYFAVTGAVNSLSFAPDAIYAGTSFVYDSAGLATESPVNVGFGSAGLGGGLNTIVNDLLTITEQQPLAEGVLANGQAVEIQFNRLIDNQQFGAIGDELLQLTLDGVRVAGYVSKLTNNDGSRLIFRAQNPLEAGKRYRVTVSGAIEDLNGQRLENDYSFRFVYAEHQQPVLEQVSPNFGSWRGGSEITLTGNGFNPQTTVIIAGISASDVQLVDQHQIKFTAPALSVRPDENRLVGIAVANGEGNGLLNDFKAASFTYVTDPQIQTIGLINSGAQHFVFNSGETIELSGPGLNGFTQVRVNGKTAVNLSVVDHRTLSFTLPDQTIGQLDVEVFNDASQIDLVNNDELVIEFNGQSQLSNVDHFTRFDDLLLVAKNHSSGTDARIELLATRGSSTPATLASVDTTVATKALSIDTRYFAVLDVNGNVSVY
ncbi:MAG: IPT/TIG domain-containing protein, partial [Algicola sp.]|nr:IPT/TIG domain-containing protein [Algicola sp.]